MVKIRNYSGPYFDEFFVISTPCSSKKISKYSEICSFPL
jgi:hypothetical protein